MSPIRGIVFDLGNTLMYFAGDWDAVTQAGVDALVEFLRAHAVAVPPEFGIAFVEMRRAGRMQAAHREIEYTATQALHDTLAEYRLDRVDAETLAGGVAAFFEPEAEQWVPYADAHSTLAQLHSQGYRLGAISNATDDALIRRLVARGGLADLLDPIVSSAAVPWRKPDPRIFQHLLDLWHCAPVDAVMVGDWPDTDILGAHRAGMRAILLEEPGATAEIDGAIAKHLPVTVPDAHLGEPDLVIHHLSELPTVLARWK